MKFSNILIFCAILTAATLSSPAQAKDDLELKSETVAWVLGLDPLPMDGLLYAGKGKQAALNGLIGIPGALAFWSGVAMAATPCQGGTPGSDCGDVAIISELLLIGGGVLYFSSLFWDLAGSVSGVKKHNRDVKAKSAARKRRWNLAVAPSEDGVLVSAQFTF